MADNENPSREGDGQEGAGSTRSEPMTTQAVSQPPPPETASTSRDPDVRSDPTLTVPPGQGAAALVVRELPEAKLDPGTRVGRYLIIECIGAGAMGQVYAAFDPELDRKVALKILRAEGPGSSQGTSHSSPERRLLREAKALSQLAHPNVVAVFDVGTLGTEVFVAMEFVAGTDLAHWFKEGPKPWEDVLDVYIQAGRGLAAAHAAGLVHRDFKPHNVVLGADGRARVLDFGLATPRSPEDHTRALQALRDQPLREQSTSTEGWEKLTQTGVVLGTPAYMAPEVLLGSGADEKSDQFSFCVSLYQGLYGVKPFQGRTLREMADAIQAGHIQESHEHYVPGWLRRAVLRGLAPDPSKRHRSMDALLEVLERRDPATRHKRLALRVGASLAALVVIVVGTAEAINRNARLCQGAQQHMADVWNPSRQHAVHQALVDTGVPYAEETWQRVRDTLDTYTAEWVAMHMDACQATHIRGEQSGEMLDLRMRCLQERRGEVKALVDVLAQADKDVVATAVPAVRNLVGLARCANLDVLRSAVPPPSATEVQRQVEALRVQLDQVHALEQTAKFADGWKMIEPLEPRARAIQYPPVLAEALLLKGTLLSARAKYKDAIPVLEEAALVAARSKHVQVAALAQRELVTVVGAALQRFDEGLARAHDAEVMMLQAGLYETLGDRLLSARGTVLMRKGLTKEAIEQQKQALELCTRVSSALQCSPITLAVATAYYRAGQFEDGQWRMREAITLIEQSLGANHPHLGRAMNNYGLILMELGHYDEAASWFEKARKNFVGAFDTKHPLVADVLNNLGDLHWWRGNYQQALELHQAGLEIRLKAFGPEHNTVGTSHVNLGCDHEDLGNYALARQHYQRCLDVKTKVLGPEHYQIGWCLTCMGSLTIKEGKLDAAEADLEKVVALWTRTMGPEFPTFFMPLSSLAKIALARRDYAKAQSLLERALHLQETNHMVNRFTAVMHLDLAKALWVTPANRAAAVQHAQQAQDILVKINGKFASLQEEIQTWLQQHPP